MHHPVRNPNLESEVVPDENADPDPAHVEPVQETVGLRHVHKTRQRGSARGAEGGGVTKNGALVRDHAASGCNNHINRSNK